MLDKNSFMETLRLVQEVAKTSTEPIDKETALSYFQDMELSQQQKEMVYEFLMLPPEDISPEEEKEQEPEVVKESEEIHEQTHFQMYLDEIEQLPDVNCEEEMDMYEKLLAGDAQVVETLSTIWLKPVISIAREYKDKGFLLDDLVQEGNIGLLMGLNELVGAGKVADVKLQLRNYVKSSIEEYINIESGDEQRNETVLGKVSLVHQAKKILSEEKGQEVSIEELASYTGVPMDEIQDILSLLKEK